MLIAALAGAAMPARAPAAPARSAQASVPGSPGACVADRPCSLSGIISGQHREGTYSWAALDADTSCTALLLPADIYHAWRRWNGRRVRVDGTALSRRPAGPEVLQLQYRDRWLSPILCGGSDLVLYVDTIARLR